MASRLDEFTIEAARFGDAMNLMAQVSVIGYAEFAVKCGDSTTELLLEGVSAMRRFLARTKHGTSTMDRRGIEVALTELAHLLAQVPLDASAVDRCVTTLCTGFTSAARPR